MPLRALESPGIFVGRCPVDTAGRKLATMLDRLTGLGLPPSYVQEISYLFFFLMNRCYLGNLSSNNIHCPYKWMMRRRMVND